MQLKGRYAALHRIRVLERVAAPVTQSLTTGTLTGEVSAAS